MVGKNYFYLIIKVLNYKSLQYLFNKMLKTGNLTFGDYL